MNMIKRVKDLVEREKACSWHDSYLRFLISELKQDLFQNVKKVIRDLDRSQIAILFNNSILGFPILKYYFTFDQEVKFEKIWSQDCKGFHPEAEDGISFSEDEKSFFQENVINDLKGKDKNYLRELVTLSFGVESPAIIKKSLAANIMCSSGGHFTFTYWDYWAKLPVYKKYPEDYPIKYFLIEKRFFSNRALILCTKGDFAIFIAFKRPLNRSQISITYKRLNRFFNRINWINDLIWLIREETFFFLEEYELHLEFTKYVKENVYPILQDYVYKKSKREEDILKIFEEFITKPLKERHDNKEKVINKKEEINTIAKIESPPLNDMKLHELFNNKPSYINRVYKLRKKWLDQRDNIWYLFNNIPEMALHNEIHSQNLEKLLTEFFLKKENLFILWAASWLHDVGLFEYAEKITQLIKTKKGDSFAEVRKLHGEISYKRIIDNGKRWGLLEEDIKAIATISKYHTSYSTDKLKDEISNLITFGKSEEIPLIFFILSLRVLDALDIQINRWQGSFEKIVNILNLSKKMRNKDSNFSEYLRLQMIHFIKHSAFISVRISQAGEVVYLPNFEMPLILVIFSLIKAQEDIKKELKVNNNVIRECNLGEEIKNEVKELIGYKEHKNGKIKIGGLTIDNNGQFQIRIRCFNPIKDDLRQMCKVSM